MKTPAMLMATTVPPRPRKRGLIANIIGWILDIDDITPEEARERMRLGSGFFASLTPEQQEYARNYDGPEYLGPPVTWRNRRFLLKERP
jgi:hypothetical protein